MVTAEPPRRLTVTSRHVARDDQIILAVSDTGPGVPDAIRRRIFDPFFTTKPIGAGTGIGLTVCHGMVSAHGGTIDVDAAPGGGAQFIVCLPCGGAGDDAAASVPAAHRRRRGARILVVDDEPEIRGFLAELLGMDGHEVETASSGRRALERIAVASGYDAIVCDLRMPDVDGPELFANLARERPELLGRFIFTTGDVLSDPSRRFLEQCDRPCLEKPFLPDQLRTLLDQVLAAGVSTGTRA
jgi:CheY-like chemotaxis protein